jgi:hypothetical protein
MKKLMILSCVLMSGIMNALILADRPTLSIYDIQYTEDQNGKSYYDTNYVNCTGGIVIHKYQKSSGSQRIVLYDPNYPDGWGGILVKGVAGATPFQNVSIGDWVSLTNVLVCEEAYKAVGTTTLYFDGSSSFFTKSINNPLPEPILVDVNDIAVVYDDLYETCYVTDHRAEKYEDMYLQVRNVTVGYMDVGKAMDNYSLVSIEDPNIYCWASDYINDDLVPPALYLPKVVTGQSFCSVSGILEQYTKLSDGWDYYQLLTTEDQDLAIEQTGDFDGNCDVDFIDYAYFAKQWFKDDCGEPDWCGGADLPETRNGTVDFADLYVFTQHWLEGTE